MQVGVVTVFSCRTLRMLRLFGDGDKFSQKRLRAPQDVGLGRRKEFGNREYFREEQLNRIEPDNDDNYYDYQYQDYIDSEEYIDEVREILTENSIMSHTMTREKTWKLLKMMQQKIFLKTMA